MKRVATAFFAIIIAVSWLRSEPLPASMLASNAVAPGTLVEFNDSYFWPKAFVLFDEYKTSLRQSRFDAAVSTLNLIYSLLVTDNARMRFWQEVIPDGRRRVMILYQICPDCKTGKCPACNGKRICPLCHEKKYCLECKGRGLFSKQCTVCLCRRCGASGICHTCWGYKVLKCPVCKGTGLTGQELGKKCPKCGGNGRVNCLECGGSGKCPICTGKGRISNCPQCGGKGMIITRCDACQGSGRCPCCQNSGICPVCKGSAVCPRCKQNGIIMRYRFPVQTDWLRVSPGVVLHLEYSVVTNQILNDTGIVNVDVGSHNLNLNIQSDEILCISETEQFEWIKNHVLQ